jgi:hypothetical protein
LCSDVRPSRHEPFPGSVGGPLFGTGRVGFVASPMSRDAAQGGRCGSPALAGGVHDRRRVEGRIITADLIDQVTREAILSASKQS